MLVYWRDRWWLIQMDDLDCNCKTIYLKCTDFPTSYLSYAH